MLGANGAGKSTIMRAVERPAAARVRLDPSRRQRVSSRLEAHRIVPPALVLVPEGRQVFPELSVRDNLMLGAFTRKDVDVEAEIEALLDRFPRLKRAPRRPRRAAVGRRAADAGHSPRPDGQAAGAAARRALAGSGARHHRRAVRDARRAARQRHHHPVGRPDGGAGLDGRRPWLRAGIGPHRARRHGRGAGEDPALEAAYLGGLEAAE